VTCGLEQKVERFARRMGLPRDAARAEVARRSAAQWSDDQKAQKADYVIENSGSMEALEQQVEKIWAELTRPAAKQ